MHSGTQINLSTSGARGTWATTLAKWMYLRDAAIAVFIPATSRPPSSKTIVAPEIRFANPNICVIRYQYLIVRDSRICESRYTNARIMRINRQIVRISA
nr:MAG TPA: hypothetical protein [Caudoviricetes sp.]